MKKAYWFRTFFTMLMVFSLCFSSIAFADPIDAQNDDFTDEDEVIQEREEITLDDILTKLNSELDPKDWLTELPFDDDIEIPEPGDNVYEEPEHFYPENMTEHEIAAVIERIANGEHAIFGDGVERDFSDQIEAPLSRSYSLTRWSSGTSYATHQWLVVRGWVILTNDYPLIGNCFTSAQIAQVQLGADWPDENETGPTTLAGISTFSSHFFNYPTGTNYIWGSSPTAKSKLISWYNSAVNKYKRSYGNTDLRDEAFHDLGKAIHYLSDIGSPPHTGDRAFDADDYSFIVDPGLAFFHACYETDADNNKTSYRINSSNLYSWYNVCGLDYIAEVNAGISYKYYPGISSTGTTYWNSVKNPLELTQQDVAGLLYKFYKDTNNLIYH